MNKTIVLSLFFVLLSSWILAAPVAYTNKASFLSNVSVVSPQSINFDSYDAGTILTNQTISGITFRSPGSIPLQVINASSGVRNPMVSSSGTKILSPGGSNLTQEEDDLELIFANPLRAFGMDVIFDTPDGASFVSASFYDASNNLIHQIGPHIPAPTGGITFVGLVADSVLISRVVIDDFDPSAPDDHIAYDSLVFCPVPEPTSFLLLCLASLGMALILKRK
ncbi:MAG: PEP-CTERM sorting domain-containing protein [Candidatus Brocadiae bacterium]|nr:PEP-CTERM sorting domain-containing protein [Candidatus Brocadiia bacterium]